MGDSNAARFMLSIKRSLGCNVIKTERGTKSVYHPNPGYYMRDTRPIRSHERSCKHCHSSKLNCPQFGVTVEFLSGEYVIDTELTTLRMKANNKAAHLTRLCEVSNKAASKPWGAGGLPCTDTHNSQQFLLKEYLAGQYPDLFLYFSNNHDKQVFTAAEFHIYNRLLGGLFNLYLPGEILNYLFTCFSHVLHPT